MRHISLVHDLPKEVRRLLERTFSADPAERERCARLLRQYSGHARIISPFLIRLIGDEEGMRSRGICINAEACGTLEEFGPAAFDSLIAALPQKNRLGRKWIIDLLGELGDRRAVEPLMAVLSDDDPEVREFAVKALGNISDPRALPALQRALGDQAGEVVGRAAIVLGDAKASEAVDGLVAVVENTEVQPWARERAARSLGKIGDPRAFAGLRRVLENRKFPPELRANAAWAIGQLGDQRAFEPLKDVLFHDPADVRAGAVSGLLALSHPHTTEVLLDALDRPAEGPADERWDLACGLVSTQTPAGIDAAVAYFDRNRRDLPGWSGLLAMLGRSSEPRAYLRVIEALSDDEWIFRSHAARLFAESLEYHHAGVVGVTEEDLATQLPALRDPRIVPPLMNLVQNRSEHTWTRQCAAIALGKTGDARAEPVLQTLLKAADEDENMRKAAQKALEWLPQYRLKSPERKSKGGERSRQ